MNKTLPLFILAAFLCCSACAPKTQISRTFDFNKMNRIGVLAFSSPDNAFEGAENIFAQNLIRRGYTVVERAQIEKILRERGFKEEDFLHPKATREVGQILGVDVLLTGQITSFLPEQRVLAYSVSKRTTSEPVFRSEVVNMPEGGTVVRTERVGTQQRRERNVQPFEHTIFAQVGVVARMVDVKTAEIVWIGSGTAQGVSGLNAVSSIASSLIRDFDSQVRRARKKR